MGCYLALQTNFHIHTHCESPASMTADHKDDDPVTLTVFNVFREKIFERFDAMQRQLDEERKAQLEERKAQAEERKAQAEERKAQERERKAQAEERKALERERKAREEEQKRFEEAFDEIWKQLGEYNLIGALKKAILLRCCKFAVFTTQFAFILCEF
jgi:hypothetical protein